MWFGIQRSLSAKLPRLLQWHPARSKCATRMLLTILTGHAHPPHTDCYRASRGDDRQWVRFRCRLRFAPCLPAYNYSRPLDIPAAATSRYPLYQHVGPVASASAPAATAPAASISARQAAAPGRSKLVHSAVRYRPMKSPTAFTKHWQICSPPLRSSFYRPRPLAGGLCTERASAICLPA